MKTVVSLILIFATLRGFGADTENFYLEISKTKNEVLLHVENLDRNTCQLNLDQIKIKRSSRTQKGVVELYYSRNLEKKCTDPESTELKPVRIPRSNQLPGIGPNKGSYDFFINGRFYRNLKFFNLNGWETRNG
jgi:hypothetical protein